jgi:serine/threonine protein kinase
MSSQALLSAGTVLSERYRIVGVLGRGGMGAVYLVEDRQLYGKYWALKELLERFSDEIERAEAIAQFRHEVQILVTLRHPNLPQVVDAFEAGGRQYLVMEYIEGQTLKQVLDGAPGKRLPEEHVLSWAAQICDVLDYLHHHDPPVIFRDLKPDNVMITSQGQVKLIDFGVARLFDPAKGTDTLKMGTAGYAPPEQYAGQGQTTPCSDVYALGATLHELLTGDSPTAHPFVFTSARRLNRQVSARTSRAVTKALQMDPTERFPSISSMRAVLLEGRRRAVPLLLVVLPLLLLLAGLAAGGWWLWRNDPFGWRAVEPTPTPPAVGAQPTPSPTPTLPPTSTRAPTFTPTPTHLAAEAPAPAQTTTPASTRPPTSTPVQTRTRTPTPTRSGSPSPSATPTPTPEGNPEASSATMAPTPSRTPSPLPTPRKDDMGRIFYTVDAGQTYYLATTDPSWSQGQMLDPVAYGQSTCGGGSTTTTLAGQTVNLFYGYRCAISHPKECPSPDGAYKVNIWEIAAGKYSLSVVRLADDTLVQGTYEGPLNIGEPLLWAPDSSHFYFTIDHTLHRASPYAAGYEPVIPIAYESHLSPDGSMLLYLQPVGTVGAYDLWVAGADGSNARNVTGAPSTYKLCARWGG